ncbi:hypothetical protein [Streptomyces sp. NPDC024089]|uniref:DUF6907 domain-containing protein n=1 Tax=Streptomyces sp. NPDC024089 TaxID=3154328 RepID=UPI0033C2CCFB
MTHGVMHAAVGANAPTVPSIRIVPATVSGTRVYIECPAWCTVDHVASPEGFLEDVWHGGDYANLNVPRIGRDDELFSFARLGVDPVSSDPARRNAFVFVDDGSEGYEMSPGQADRFADNLEMFAAQIRAMAATAKAEVAA